MGAPYQYSPLNASEKEIRLLRLSPGEWESRIECEIYTVPLSEKPKYAALSYVWGSDKDQKTISLNGCDFYVNLNLFHALRRMRAHNGMEVGIIWTDAICINQRDNDEKSWQVGLMGRIYGSCSQVIIWLGELQMDESKTQKDESKIQKDECKIDESCIRFNCDETDFGHHWGKYLDDFGLKPDGVKTPDFSEVSGPKNPNVNMTFHLAWFFRLVLGGEHIAKLPPCSSEKIFDSQYRKDLQNAAVTFYKNQYFKRVWIVQETALAPSASVLFGGYCFPLKSLADAFEKFHSHRKQNCCQVLHRGFPQVWDSFRLCLLKFRTILGHRERYLKNEPINLFSLCYNHSDRQATEKVDRVFAMLSLVTNWNDEEPLVPDYSYKKADSKEERKKAEDNAIAKVYAQVSKACLNSAREGWLKTPLIASPLQPSIPNLPSWALDWDTVANKQLWSSQIAFFKADGGVTCVSKVNSEDVLLTVGFPVDKISKIGKELVADYPPEYESERIDSARNEVLKSWKELLPCGKELDTPYPGGGTWLNAWCRTLSGDFCPAGDGNIRRMTTQDVTAFANAVLNGDYGDFRVFSENPLPQPSSRTTSNNPEVEQFNLSHKVLIGCMFPERRLFVTASGYLGFGREDIQVGDGIVILPGAQTPCVLRRVDRKFVMGDKELSSHKSIGGCYVHGIMDGEGVRGEEELFGII